MSHLMPIAILIWSLTAAGMAAEPMVTITPAPSGEVLSKDFRVAIGNREVPVYVAKVGAADPARRWKGMDDPAHSADYFDSASFASFDMDGQITVTVTCPTTIANARILPLSAQIMPVVNGNSLTCVLAKPRLLTIEINDNWVGSLHLFANPLETDAPKPGDPGVIYFGPGIHEVSHLVVTDNQTVYVAGGAVVRAVIKPDEPFSISSFSGLRTYSPTFELRGKHITFRGRGIIDASACTTHARNLVFVSGSDISLEGVILRDASTWTVPIRQADRVTVKNLKLLGYRANSDGIDICNSRDVIVEGCFIRTLDDLVVIKSDQGQGAVKHVVVTRCVLWNQCAHALSVGAELRDPVDDVLFSDCDIIHDKGREWTLRVFHTDSAAVNDVRFENIRVEDTQRLISLWLGKAVWSRDQERGHIRGVSFKDITATGRPLAIELIGIDDRHLIEDVTFERVLLNDVPLAKAAITSNAFTRNVVIRP